MRSCIIAFSNYPGSSRRILDAGNIDTIFFASDNTVSVIFGRDSTKSINSLTVYEEDYITPYNRIPDSTAPGYPSAKHEIVLDSLTLENYVGVYRLDSQFEGPDSVFTLTVTLKDDELYAAAHNTDPVQIVPSAPDRFSTWLRIFL